MTFTYTAPTTDLGKVRFLIGDTVSTDPQLSDEEINYLLESEGSVSAAAIGAARALIAKFSRLVDKSVDGLRLNYSQRVGAYEKLLKQLQTRQAIKTGGVIAGGISKARKETVEQDPDRVPPFAARGEFDYPGTDNPGPPYNSPASYE